MSPGYRRGASSRAALKTFSFLPGLNEHSIYLSNEDRKRSAFSSPDAHFTKRNELGFWVRRSVSSKPVMPPDTTLLDGDPEAEEVEWLKKQFQPTDMVNKGTAIKIQVSVPRALHWNASGKGWPPAQ